MLLLWCLSMIQVFSYPLGKSSFHPFVDIKKAIVISLVAECHLIMLRCFHKPTTSLFFSLLVFQQLCSTLLRKDVLKFICSRRCSSSSFFSLHYSFRRLSDIALFEPSSFHIKIMFSFHFWPINRSVVSSIQVLSS